MLIAIAVLKNLQEAPIITVLRKRQTDTSSDNLRFRLIKRNAVFNRQVKLAHEVAVDSEQQITKLSNYVPILKN